MSNRTLGNGDEEVAFDLQARRRRLTGRTRLDGVHTLGEPHLRAPVQIGEIDRDAVGFDLGQERLLELAERSLDLALAFGVAGLA